MREASRSPNTRRRLWVSLLLVLMLLAGAGAAYWYDLVSRELPGLTADPPTEPSDVAAPTGLDLPEWSPPDTSTGTALKTELLAPQRVARALRRPLADPDLGNRVSVAVRALDGDGPTWTAGPGRFIPASTTKVATAAAVLATLGPDHRFTTRVVRGQGPREVVLVGGGDPYLASMATAPEDQGAVYPVRVDLATLAADTAAALQANGISGRVRVTYDDSYFSGPSNNPRWRADYVPDDIVSPITALMADGGREEDGWRREDDPSRAAAQDFAAALRDAGVTVAGPPRPAAAPGAGAELATVESAPLYQSVTRMLEVSDNEAAEVLARHVGLAVSGEGSFAAGSAAVVATLAELGVDTTGVVLYDGSGLSRHNRLTAQALLELIEIAAAPGGEQIRTVLTGVPVSGFSGSLTWRFDDQPPVVLGSVRAKTGTLSGVHALAGIVVGRDGLPMAFVVAADRAPEARRLDAQIAVDHVAAALATCRCARPQPASG